MVGEGVENRSSQDCPSSLKDAFLHCDLEEQPRSSEGPLAEEVRPLLANRYFNIDHLSLWKPSLLGTLGETCCRALHVDDYHVLLCHRRLIIVNSQGQHIVFPPFDEELKDAYVEKVSETCTLVLAAVSSGVHAALVRHSDSNRADTLQSAFCPTAAAVSRIHNLKKNLYGLCCENCTVESLSVTLGDIRSPKSSLQISVTACGQGWIRTARDYFSVKRYVNSLFDRQHGYLLLLSNRSVSLWMYRDEIRLQLECSAELRQATAVAIVPSPMDGEEEGEQIALLITEEGGRTPLYLRASPGKNGISRSLSIGELRGLPRKVSNMVVSEAYACDSSALLVDQMTSSLVLLTPSEVFCEAPHSPTTCVVTQHFLGKRILGAGVEKRTCDGGCFLTFLVYCGDSTIVRLGRMPRGQLLQRHFAASAQYGAAALNTLEPEARVALLIDGALCGLSTADVKRHIDPLLHPHMLTDHTVRLSDGARGIVAHTMRRLKELSRLCSSFHYSQLPVDLTQSLSRLEKVSAIFTEALTCGGWLDCPAPVGVKWDGAVITLQHGKHSTADAINAQAEVLQQVLASAKDATIITWLYDLLLENDTTYRFPGRLEDMLWRRDPATVQTAFCMDLLALHNRPIIKQLQQKEAVLPLRCRLAISLSTLVHEKSLEQVMTFVRKHILDIVHCDLLSYTTALLENNFPTAQPRIQLLVYQYPHDNSVSTQIVAKVEAIASTDELYDTLVTVFDDPACDDGLTRVLLGWMESHDLAHHRIATFARVVVDMNLCVDPALTVTGRFFSTAKQQATGNAQQAAMRFMELARSDLSVPLCGRLLAIEYSMAATLTDENQFVHFLLLLQQQLSGLISEHLMIGKDLVCSRSTMEADLLFLQHHYVKDNPLFELAGRYKALGGCSIQLDLLKVHPDSAEFLITNAITGVLTFLKAVGLSAAQAVQRVLREYLRSFQAPLPLFPFLEFLAFDGMSPSDAMAELEMSEVPLSAVFDTFLCSLDGSHKPLFQVGETVEALARLVSRLDSSVRHICAAHLLECSRSVLAGEQRTISVSDEDVDRMKRADEEMWKVSQRGAGAF